MGHGAHIDHLDFDGFGNIIEAIQAMAATRPDAIAIVDESGCISYSELQSLVLRHAAHLADLGIRPRDRFGLVLQDHANHIILMLAAAALGTAAVTINWMGKVEEKRAVVGAFDLKLLIHDPGARVPPGTPAVPLDAQWHQKVEQAQPLPPLTAARHLPLKVMLTSGTTGTPKGVEMTHESLFAMCRSFRSALDWTFLLRHLSASPLAFAGTYNFCMPLLLAGHTVELFPPVFSPEEYVDAVRQRGITSVVIVPTVLRRLLPLARGEAPLLPQLRCLIVTGGPLSADEKRMTRKMLSPRLFEVYGASGCGPITVLQPEDIDRAADSVGRAAPLREVQVVDGNGQPLPANRVGLVRCRGPGASERFCNRGADAPGETFKDGWYYPGELAQFDNEGFLRIVGRTSDVIVRAGTNIYPVEIEETLLRHPGVVDAAVVGAPSTEFGEEVVAFVCASSDVRTRDLLESCRRSLAAYKMPKDIIFVDSLPKSAAGKVRKPDLLRILQAEHSARVAGHDEIGIA